MKAKLEEVTKLKLPTFDGLSDAFWVDAGRIIGDGVSENILMQQQADGSPIKENSPGTLAKKAELNRGQRSLIDQFHRLVRKAGASWKLTKKTTRGIEVGPATPEIKMISREVQKKGYRGWFGISLRTSMLLRGRLKSEILRLLKGGK